MKARFREPINGFTHLAGAILAVIGTIYLLVAGGKTSNSFMVLLLYGISQIFLYSSSATYHLANISEEGIKKLRKLDHSAIFISIAGTYTPVCAYYFTGFWQFWMPVIVWSIGIFGILSKVFFPAAPRWISTFVYLGMGWFAVLGIGELFSSMPNGAIFWFFAGGFFFTVGAIIYAMKKPNFFGGKFGFHEIWHLFVLAGSTSHYIMIAAYIAPNY